MPTVQAELVSRGMDLANYFVENPLCCPSRATLLTGQASHTTGVYTNHEPSGFEDFKPNEGSTIATWLQDGGYYAGLVGKYLNGLGVRNVDHIPPGWDQWYAMVESYYYNTKWSLNGTLVTFGDDPEDYGIDLGAGFAAEFIMNAPADQPLFLWFAPPAPHAPATPPDRYVGAFDDLQPWRPPSYNEFDIADKPLYIRALPRLDKSARAKLDTFRRDQYSANLAVDDAVQAILTALEASGRLKHSVVIFTSDNGFTWGEHRMNREKNTPYEEAIRAPLIVRWDGVVAAGATDRHLVSNMDIAPTLAAIGGVDAPDVEGMSLLPVLTRMPTAWRSDLLIEHAGSAPLAPPFCGVRNKAGLTYVDYFTTGEEELYDLTVDPYQMRNRANDPDYAQVLAALRNRSAELCVPLPPEE
jgi:N-acetylglucosamine-6-sulfatase